MSADGLLALPLVMAAVFLVSGVAKLRNPDDLAGWAALGVPAALRRRSLVRLHPWGEIALAVALACLGGALGLIAGLASLGLMFAYLLLVARAMRAAPDAACSCFGTRRPVTRRTAARNAWLTALAAATTAVIWSTPLWGGALAGLWSAGAWSWGAAVAVAVITVLVIVWPDAPAAAEVASPPPAVPTGDDGELDYVRVRTPAVPVTLGDGSTVNLRELTAERPLLLLAVSQTCGACMSTIAAAPAWRARLPEVDVRLLLDAAPVPGSLVETDEPLTLHDPEGYVSESISGRWPTPTAVLLGIDGLLAGGPVTGEFAVAAFVEEIREVLDEAASVTAP